MGKAALNAWLCVVAISMNLMVMKQITIFGLNVTATDALAVGYILGLNLLQEFYGKREARLHVWLSFFCSAIFLALTRLHLLYEPNAYDTFHSSYAAIFGGLGRLIVASFISFVSIQFLDIRVFGWLKDKFSGKKLAVRVWVSLILSQTFDTLIFSFLGLYGLVENIWDVILLSLAIKGIILTIASPFSSLASYFSVKQVYRPQT